MPKELYAWSHLSDKSHFHLSLSPTEPPPLAGTSCATKAIYYDEKATEVARAWLGDMPTVQPEKKDE